MVRSLLVAGLLALGTACSSLATLHGARTLEPGQVQVGTAMSLQRGGTPLSYAGIPLPQVELHGRVGVSPDLDVGARAYLLGTAFDARYRFYHQGNVHVAVDPTLATFAIPTFGQGSVEAHAPVLAEVELSDLFSVSGGPRLIFRNQWNSVEDATLGKGRSSRLDVFAGGGARIELHTRRIALGLSTDLYGQPARHGGTSWSTGMDLGFRLGRRER